MGIPNKKRKKYKDTALNKGSKGYNTHNLRDSEGHTHSWSYFRSVQNIIISFDDRPVRCCLILGNLGENRLNFIVASR